MSPSRAVIYQNWQATTASQIAYDDSRMRFVAMAGLLLLLLILLQFRCRLGRLAGPVTVSYTHRFYIVHCPFSPRSAVFCCHNNASSSSNRSTVPSFAITLVAPRSASNSLCLSLFNSLPLHYAYISHSRDELWRICYFLLLNPPSHKCFIYCMCRTTTKVVCRFRWKRWYKALECRTSICLMHKLTVT